MKPLIIAIAGGTGSGKSTVAHRIAEYLPASSAAFLEMDAYYHDFSDLDPEHLENVNWDHPDSFDLELLGSHLSILSGGTAVDSPQYEFVSHSRLPITRRVEPADVIVIDGILLLTDQTIRDLCDIKVFLDTDADTRLIRRIRRDMATRGRTLQSVLDQYESSVKPMHLQFVEPSKRYADIIIPRGESNGVAIEMIVARINQRLQQRDTPSNL